MKTLIISATFLLIAFGASAQTTKVKSKAVANDSIYLVKGSFEMSPIVVNLQKDTGRSLNYSILLGRDTTTAHSVHLIIYNRAALPVATFDLAVPASSKLTTLINSLDAFIASRIPQIQKQ